MDRPSGRQPDTTAQQTRQRILLSARAVFASGGYDGVSLRDIAAHAGVTHGLLRHHFGSKEDIWRGVIDATLAEYRMALEPLLAQATAQGRPARAIAEDAARTVVVQSARYPDVLRLLMHESVRGGPCLDYFMEQLAPLRDQMTPIVTAVQREGELQQFDRNTYLLFLLMTGVMPLALAAFTNALCGVDILAPNAVDEHAERVVATLFRRPPALPNDA